MSVVVSILLTLLLLSILVFVHEFGHFIVAKLMGIRVLEFALFMGPKIFSFKRGDTVYSLRCIPIGGFCSMEGEETTSEDDKAFSNKPWYKRAAVLVAGAGMNIVLAIVLSIVLFATSGYSSLAVAEVVPGSPADLAGVAPGDKIVAVDGSGVSSDMERGVYESMFPTEDGKHTYTIKKADGSKVELSAISESYAGIRTKVYSKTDLEQGVFVAEVAADSLGSENGLAAEAELVSMNGQAVDDLTEFRYYRETLEAPLTYVFENPDGTRVTIVSDEESKNVGVSLYGVEKDEMEHGVFTLLGDSFQFTFSMVKVTIKSFIWLFNGTASVDEVTGPVGMVTIVNDTVASASSFASGALTFLLLAILISVNLGVFNLLPFPALDGGRLVFTIIEGITRKKIKPEVEAIISAVGFVLLIGLSILILIKDVVKLF